MKTSDKKNAYIPILEFHQKYFQFKNSFAFNYLFNFFFFLTNTYFRNIDDFYFLSVSRLFDN